MWKGTGRACYTRHLIFQHAPSRELLYRNTSRLTLILKGEGWTVVDERSRCKITMQLFPLEIYMHCQANNIMWSIFFHFFLLWYRMNKRLMKTKAILTHCPNCPKIFCNVQNICGFIRTIRHGIWRFSCHQRSVYFTKRLAMLFLQMDPIWAKSMKRYLFSLLIPPLPSFLRISFCFLPSFGFQFDLCYLNQ